MSVSGRLLETGHDAQGRAVVLADRDISPIELAGPAVSTLVFGGRDDIASFPETVIPAAIAAQVPPGGWRCATLTLAAGADDLYQDFVVRALGPLADPTDPGFHKTSTTDVIHVLSGTLALDLDGGESRTLGIGDTTVLNGVRHRWRNVGMSDAVLFCVQIGAHHAAPAPAAPHPVATLGNG